MIKVLYKSLYKRTHRRIYKGDGDEEEIEWFTLDVSRLDSNAMLKR